ncbi:MAG: YkgJ family cysteine cluster protein [Pseudomonadales bacterium]|nr:YkgJ family cysteine cluster protein [Pseudomonadales bacterium]
MGKRIPLKADTGSKCDLCTSSICCTYVTQEIDKPTTIRDFDILMWQMYHKDVQIYTEDRRWYLKILNSCLNLLPDGRCGIYDERPFICREHENEFCEYDESTEKSADLFFGSADALDKYCKKRFKSWKKRFKKKKK